ncbi:MAG: hypothetical protein LUI87_14760, partial [Lachnospiraceae bacterium]|nr:hypothetical protein [Lachnospiraceae bacterium]
MGEIIVAIIVVCLFVALCLLGIYLISFAALAMAAFYAIKNYCLAIGHNINFKNWDWKGWDGVEKEPARRSYFFGPGYVQLARTIKESFQLNIRVVGKLNSFAGKIRGSGVYASVLSLDFFRIVVGYAFQVFAYISLFGIGTVLCVLFGLLHGLVTTLVMAVTYVVFSIVWLMDRAYLTKNKIFSDCPLCHERFLVPWFECPNPACQKIHKKLIPGPYGIWNHRCECGEKLPSTFLNGRSRLKAYCPECQTPLAAADARPVVFQLVGGTCSGK